MSFEHPVRLLGLLLLLPLAFLEWRALSRADRSVKLLLGVRPLPGLLLQLLPRQRVITLALRFSALTLLAMGAAGPQWGREAVRRQSQGSDVVFVIDVSASMETRDVPPSRMEETRREAVALLGHLAGNRVGVVAFAGDAVRLCPLTLDQAAVRLTLETIGAGTVSEPGSDLGRALRAGLKLLPAGHRDEQAMVVWTDGEDLEGHAREALAEVRNAGLRVLTVGVGTPAGDVIPIADVAGVTVDMKRDEKGQVVRSRLDEPLLREIARGTRGLYFSGSRSGGELVRLASALGSLARSRQGTRLVERPVARFPLLALLASAGVARVPRRAQAPDRALGRRRCCARADRARVPPRVPPRVGPRAGPRSPRPRGRPSPRRRRRQPRPRRWRCSCSFPGVPTARVPGRAATTRSAGATTRARNRSTRVACASRGHRPGCSRTGPRPVPSARPTTASSASSRTSRGAPMPPAR
jgi:Ca-activated chloride channel family protein